MTDRPITHRNILSERLIEVVGDTKYSNVLELGARTSDFDKIINHDTYLKTDFPDVDAHNLPYDDDTYDLVFMSHTFEHFVNPIQALFEINRVLKPNGTVIIVNPYHCDHQVIGADADHLFVLTEIQFRRLLRYTNYKDINVFTQIKFRNAPIELKQDFNTFAVAKKQ